MKAKAINGLFTITPNSKKEGDFLLSEKIGLKMLRDSDSAGYTTQMIAICEFDNHVRIFGENEDYWAKKAMAEYKRIKAELKH